MDLTPRQAFPYGHPDKPAQDDLQYFRDELAAELAAEARAIFEPQPATAAAPPATLTLHIGRLRPVPVASAEQASRIWQLYRNGLCLASSESPKVLIKHQGQTVGYVSYNGRVWAGKPTGLPKGAPIAEAAKVEGVQVGDWLYAEDMMTERGTMMEVKAVYGPARAITLEDPTGKLCDRIYVREQTGHDRFHVNFQLA